jgi:hypothetical protein
MIRMAVGDDRSIKPCRWEPFGHCAEGNIDTSDGAIDDHSPATIMIANHRAVSVSDCKEVHVSWQR